MDAIVTDGLSKTYGSGGLRGLLSAGGRGSPVRALQGLSITVRSGEIFGFLGPNGAGKSTAIRLLLGFLHPTAGSARVLGLDVRTQSVEVRQRIGYLPGGISFYDGMTGDALLDYLGQLSGGETPLRQELVDRLELSPANLRRPIRDYSRGMRQKLGIIQALQSDPDLAVLDEPTEGLDPLMQLAFYELLKARRAAGRTIFFSSHVLSEVERVCDRVAIIRSGELVALSDVEALLARRRRHVEIRYQGEAPSLAKVVGVSDVQRHDGLLTCDLEGDVGPFLEALSRQRITDLLIEPARLEDVFLEFYSPDITREEHSSGGSATTDPVSDP